MKILVDAFGGDNAPSAVVQGSILAKKRLNCEIILVGNRNILQRDFSDKISEFEIVDAESAISMSDEPSSIMKMPNSSMAVAMKMLSENLADGLVSAGNSGALAVGATLIAKRIKGIKRCAFAPIVPSIAGVFMLIDSGANVECRPEMLYQFAVMGSIYMKSVLRIENPRVGLVNNGTESCKGDKLRKLTYELLKKSDLNFVGNIEARDVPLGAADVVVTDGFTGNVILKMYEGTAKMITDRFKEIFKTNICTKLAASALLPKIREMKKSMSPSEHGGAPILGCSRAVFKAHGNSDEKAIESAICMAYKYIKDGVIEKISANLPNNLSTSTIESDENESTE